MPSYHGDTKEVMRRLLLPWKYNKSRLPHTLLDQCLKNILLNVPNSPLAPHQLFWGLLFGKTLLKANIPSYSLRPCEA